MTESPRQISALTARMRAAEFDIRNVFTRWGYEEIMTSALVDYEIFRKSYATSEAQTYKLIGEDGRILVLKPDMTTPIAQLAATQWQDVARPLRVAYFTRLFRRGADNDTRSRELFQAGVELIGDDNPQGDAEMIALAAQALAEAGLVEVQINVGHNGLLQAITDALGLGEPEKERLRKALQQRDIVRAQTLLSMADTDQGTEALAELLLPFGNGIESPDAQLERLRSFNIDPGLLDEMGQTFACLRASQPGQEVRLDLSLVRNLNYYTGVVFEIYCPLTGRRIGGGGRYDDLIGTFGGREPATGVALDLKTVARSLARQSGSQGLDEPCGTLVVGGRDHMVALWDRARALRDQGQRAVVHLLDPPCDRSVVQKMAKNMGFDHVEFLGAEGVDVDEEES